MKIHEKYISRCIEIAKKGLGTTAPNPMVGAVITCEDRIIGEGYTSAFGGPHAEVNAILSVKEPELLKKATLYVSLEPCSHHGKTPPCADLILEKEIPRVVVGLTDPNPKVAGKGIEKLKRNGCEVLSGVGQAACREHHKRFLMYHENKRPYLILKWAQSPDGFMAPLPGLRANDPQPYWISGSASRQLVHKWRGEEQAILVGTRTALEDNPKLNTRMWKGPSPLRILLDRSLKVPLDYNLYDGTAPTLVVTEKNAPEQLPSKVRFRNVSFDGDFLHHLMEVLFEEQLLSVIIEGGRDTLEGFIQEGLWDEARVITGIHPLRKGLKAPEVKGKLQREFEPEKDRVQIWRND
ncbi:bifunctional diaminohydroxyphosphoribosylaminopyrimidine deaminase/5-amino-6-(5-phosphoribosylamino)uracil reductase RibD [Robiginitalea sp. IMCC44478]|uniref:bifunctional diaminohydroxyphosphoribosylaminopyrimidine deaminase/5-amino-6-(5-phosphoribosylamino)uracil reductase RibD n=1 Tax=Robiginitalea sp. IMCC44478 TaxID=3459122 RepID=UPI004042DAD2